MASGIVIGSNKFDNIFNVRQGNYEVRGGNTNNVFFMLDPSNFDGTIFFGLNTTNFILSYSPNKRTCQFFIHRHGFATFNKRLIISSVVSDNVDIAVRFNSIANNTDIVNCDQNAVDVIVDTSGSQNFDRPDIIYDCPMVYIRPNTVMYCSADIECMFIFASTDYDVANPLQVANITVNYIATVLFRDIPVLHLLNSVTYNQKDNLLSLSLLYINAEICINLHNYLNPDLSSYYTIMSNSTDIFFQY